jgi:hypothetical protein
MSAERCMAGSAPVGVAPSALEAVLVMLGVFLVLLALGWLVMTLWARFGWRMHNVDGASEMRALTGGLASQHDLNAGERMVRRALANAHTEDDLQRVRELVRLRGIDPAFLSSESRRRLGIEWDELVRPAGDGQPHDGPSCEEPPPSHEDSRREEPPRDGVPREGL